MSYSNTISCSSRYNKMDFVQLIKATLLLIDDVCFWKFHLHEWISILYAIFCLCLRKEYELQRLFSENQFNFYFLPMFYIIWDSTFYSRFIWDLILSLFLIELNMIERQAACHVQHLVKKIFKKTYASIASFKNNCSILQFWYETRKLSCQGGK